MCNGKVRVSDIYIRKCIEWSRKEISKRKKILNLIFGAIIFILFLPALLILGSHYLDSLLHISGILCSTFYEILGIILVAVGWPLSVWSVYFQYAEGKGTPVPSAPTRKLITSGPYKYCRNPMALGTLLLYLGLAFILKLTSMVFLTFLFFIFLFLFIKLWEEKELGARFGEEYRKYKKRTPFLIPRIWSRTKDYNGE